MKNISSQNAPIALGPYSQAVQVENTLYASGQIPLNPYTGELIVSTIEKATNQVFDNIEAILKAANMTLNNVVKVTVFLKDLNDFDAINVIYANRFMDHKPARSTVQVAKLPKDAPIEIDFIAISE